MAFTNEPSDFTPVDLFGTLAVNAVATNFACKSEDRSMRVVPGFIKERIKSESVQGFFDLRFVAGVAGALVAQMSNNPNTRRYGHDIAVGTLGSYVATETCRMHAAALASTSAPAPAQITDGMSAPVAAATAQGAPNYAYGW